MEVQKNIPLSLHTSFKTGGLADYFIEVSSKNVLLEFYNWIKKEKINFFCLGGGSNLLINDAGFSGAVIKIVNKEIMWENNKSIVGAGIKLADLINEAKNFNFGGLEWAFGIPATLGGATRNNAGAFGFDFSGVVEEVEIFDVTKGEFRILKKNDCQYSYRHSIFQNKPSWIIWQVKLVWKSGIKEEIQKNILHYFKQRKTKQPLEFPSAGSFFKNPLKEHILPDVWEKAADAYVQYMVEINKMQEEEVKEKLLHNGSLPAAFLIERAGVKGKKIGGAMVSNKHANFLINFNNAKTEDIIILASVVKQKVRNKFHIQLQEEIEYVGF